MEEDSEKTSSLSPIVEEEIVPVKNVVRLNRNAVAKTLFNGRTLEELNFYYSVAIEPDMTHIQIMAKMALLSTLLHELNAELSVLELSSSLFENRLKAKRGKRFAEIKKTNSSFSVDRIEALLDQELETDNDSLLIHQFLVKCFERMQGQLVGTRKLLESCMYAATTELKTLPKS